MTKDTYSLLESHMLSRMEDSAHDKEHIYRVLYAALDIAQTEMDVDYDVLIAACLLHDIARKDQLANPSLCHAKLGSEMAYSFFMEHGFPARFAEKVCHCILTHRYRNTNPPQSVEAKILFDADKVDAAGAFGLARTLIYEGTVSNPIYSLREDGSVSTGEGDVNPSFFHEYKHKLEKVYSHFYTKRGAEIARQRQKTAIDFYNGLYNEANTLYTKGQSELKRTLQ